MHGVSTATFELKEPQFGMAMRYKRNRLQADMHPNGVRADSPAKIPVPRNSWLRDPNTVPWEPAQSSPGV